ncbi:zinc metalloproteinase-disintegrin-like 4a [Pelodytes ibericus]
MSSLEAELHQQEDPSLGNTPDLNLLGSNVEDIETIPNKLLVCATPAETVSTAGEANQISTPEPAPLPVNKGNPQTVELDLQQAEKEPNAGIKTLAKTFSKIVTSIGPSKQRRNASEVVALADIMFWLKRQCDVLDEPMKVLDEDGIWNGGWRLKALKEGYVTTQDNPRSALNVDLSDTSYSCDKLKCSLCNKLGHSRAECKEDVVCNLCSDTGHTFRTCPRAAHNFVESEEEAMEASVGEDILTVTQNEQLGNADDATTSSQPVEQEMDTQHTKESLGPSGPPQSSSNPDGFQMVKRKGQSRRSGHAEVPPGKREKKADMSDPLLVTAGRYEVLSESWGEAMDQEDLRRSSTRNLSLDHLMEGSNEDRRLLRVSALLNANGYEVVYPQKLSSQYKRDTQSKYPDMVQYRIELHGKPLVLHLEKNENLIGQDYTETHYQKDGMPIINGSMDQVNCYYLGYVLDEKDSVASISTCHGISGVIMTQGHSLIIEPLNAVDSEEHALYPYEGQELTPATCGVTSSVGARRRNYIRSRSSYTGYTAKQQDIMKEKKFIQLYLVVDNSMYLKYNGSKERIKMKLFQCINFVNLVYKPFNTFVALAGFEIWDTTDPFEVASSAKITLQRFADWRKEKLLPRKPHDNAHLITNINFDGSMVGLAYTGAMCSESYSVAVIQDYSNLPILVGATMAHEMGHSLGMEHDTISCKCTTELCIMSPKLSAKVPNFFSECSIYQFKQYLLDKKSQCLRNLPNKEDIITLPVCGNKFTEKGEDCDCGTVEECTSPCCDAATCKYKPNIECAEGLCCENCKIMTVGTICRVAKHECDLADMCDGKSSICPESFQVNGLPCRNGEGYCYNGECPSLESKCVTLWGSDSQVAEDSCYRYNRVGANFGYCTRSGNAYVPCAAKDVKCGMIYCYGGSVKPKTFETFAKVSRCNMVIGPSGMVDIGTKCAEGKVCYNAKCVSIEGAFNNTDCSAKCPGHGLLGEKKMILQTGCSDY